MIANQESFVKIIQALEVQVLEYVPEKEHAFATMLMPHQSDMLSMAWGRMLHALKFLKKTLILYLYLLFALE